MNTEEAIRSRLFALQDPGYREFQCRLMPTVDPERVIGVRTPALRQLAGQLAKTPQAAEFMSLLPHRYYDENNLHGFLIAGLRDYSAAVEAVNEFLPYIDNWATCDLMSPRVFRKHLPELLEELKVWIASGRTYTVRFGLGMLMSFYLDEAFRPELLNLAADVRSEEYYVNMMTAWFFATALAKRYDDALPYLQRHRLSKWTHNKTIQKAIESNRIPEETKAFLRTLKRK